MEEHKKDTFKFTYRSVEDRDAHIAKMIADPSFTCTKIFGTLKDNNLSAEFERIFY